MFNKTVKCFIWGMLGEGETENETSTLGNIYEGILEVCISNCSHLSEATKCISKYRCDGSIDHITDGIISQLI